MCEAKIAYVEGWCAFAFHVHVPVYMVHRSSENKIAELRQPWEREVPRCTFFDR
jgi:hypothetical protein